MLPTEGKVAEDETEGAAKLFEIPNEQGKGASTVEALEVGVFDERDERAGRAAHVIGVVDGIAEGRSA
jgi:hypothetical protein